MSKEEAIKPDLEIRRFTTIYNTFIKMNREQQRRALNFLNNKFVNTKLKVKK